MRSSRCVNGPASSKSCLTVQAFKRSPCSTLCTAARLGADPPPMNSAMPTNSSLLATTISADAPLHRFHVVVALVEVERHDLRVAVDAEYQLGQIARASRSRRTGVKNPDDFLRRSASGLHHPQERPPTLAQSTSSVSISAAAPSACERRVRVKAVLCQCLPVRGRRSVRFPTAQACRQRSPRNVG
jgi:hypothetical protein